MLIQVDSVKVLKLVEVRMKEHFHLDGHVQILMDAKFLASASNACYTILLTPEEWAVVSGNKRPEWE